MKKQPLLTQDVANRLGVSATRVHDLDDVLQPVRTPNGTRIYSAERVDAVAAERRGRKS